MKRIYFCTLLILPLLCSAQNRGNVWCFGDSAGIDFNNGAIPISSSINSRGSCVSISNSNGQLQFYAASMMFLNMQNWPFLTKVFDSNDSLMSNGDSIRATGWYKELIIVPMPDDSMKYYLFSIGVTSGSGFSYSIIDMAQNGGLGSVVQKNVLLETFPCTDGLSAVQHGNGRDWWIILRRWDYNNDEFYKYLITPAGISGSIIQQVGSFTMNGFTNINFSPNGSQIAMINLAGLMEIYDFDRCTGIISNPVTIHPEPTAPPYGRFFSCDFSANGQYLYVVVNFDTSYLYQYDLLSFNPAATRINLYMNTNEQISMGQVKRAPDEKIYLSSWWLCSVPPYCYPYPDSVYNNINMNLGVVNYPDSLGLSSNFSPFSFNLGGKRTYIGLPNNPNYELGPLAGSPCDTLVGIQDLVNHEGSPEMYIYYESAWQSAFINANKLTGTSYKLQIFDALGKEVFQENGKLNPPYFTKNLNCTSYAYGIYTVVFQTTRERLIKRFVRN